MWDEGFHILAARLIAAGKRPYLDFFFAQTPLNAYWNAAWISIFGANWRVIHAVAALATIGSVILLVQYLYTLFSDRQWRLSAAFAGLGLFGFHAWVWKVGTVSQAYPLCLLLLVAGFRTGIVAVARQRFTMSALAGLLTGAAAASSLLAAPAAPVLLIWMWVNHRAGNRSIKIAAFLAGGIAACVPFLVLFVRGPHQVVFEVLKYHSLYRLIGWAGATGHDIGIVTDWVNSSPDLLLVLLAAAGLLFLQNSGFDAARRAEVRLCLWLALAMGAQNLFAHPTFPMYFVFMIPFLTVPAVLGFHALVTRLGNPDRARPAVVALVGITVFCLANSIYDYNDYYTWPELEEVAAKVKQVTPKGAPLFAPEHIYFLANWPVPSGMEYDDSHKIDLGAAENAALHVVPRAEVDRRIEAGAFSTVVICENDTRVDTIKSWKVYSQASDVQDCTIFSQPEKSQAEKNEVDKNSARLVALEP